MFFGSPHIALLAYPLLPIVAAIIILRVRNRTTPVVRAPGIIYVTQIVAVSVAGWAAVAASSRAWSVLRPNTGVNTWADVAAFQPWPKPPTPYIEENDGSPYVIFADIDRVRLAVPQADLGTQLLQIAGDVLSQLPVITIGIFVAVLCGRIIHGAPFARRLVQLSWTGAGVLLVAGFAGQLVSSLAAHRLAVIAFAVIAAHDPSAELPTPIWPAGVDLWPLWGAMALGILAVLINHGVRLQKETEGLI